MSWHIRVRNPERGIDITACEAASYYRYERCPTGCSHTTFEEASEGAEALVEILGEGWEGVVVPGGCPTYAEEERYRMERYEERD